MYKKTRYEITEITRNFVRMCLVMGFLWMNSAVGLNLIYEGNDIKNNFFIPVQTNLTRITPSLFLLQDSSQLHPDMAEIETQIISYMGIDELDGRLERILAEMLSAPPDAEVRGWKGDYVSYYWDDKSLSVDFYEGKILSISYENRNPEREDIEAATLYLNLEEQLKEKWIVNKEGEDEPEVAIWASLNIPSEGGTDEYFIKGKTEPEIRLLGSQSAVPHRGPFFGELLDTRGRGRTEVEEKLNFETMLNILENLKNGFKNHNKIELTSKGKLDEIIDEIKGYLKEDEDILHRRKVTMPTQRERQTIVSQSIDDYIIGDLTISIIRREDPVSGELRINTLAFSSAQSLIPTLIIQALPRLYFWRDIRPSNIRLSVKGEQPSEIGLVIVHQTDLEGDNSLITPLDFENVFFLPKGSSEPIAVIKQRSNTSIPLSPS